MKLSRTFAARIVFLVTVMFFASGVAAGKDSWVQVRSKNFTLIGNASEKEIRAVGTKLEQFRETFRLLFTNMNVNSGVPTNVIVFKNAASYRDFKPKRADGKVDENIAGYFQSGEDVNYITLSTEGTDKEMYGTIFHEYVHSILDMNYGKSDVPAWFNEGLAEYYQTFEIAKDQEIKLGLIQDQHLYLLQQSRLMPLDTLFNISNYQLHQTADHSRSIFYAQSWALIHYLIQGGKTEELGKFLKAMTNGKDARTAFETAFQTSYKNMETELQRYVKQSRFNYRVFTLNRKLVFDADMRTTVLTDAQTNAYIGDLLYHIHRENDAEPFLTDALKLDPASSVANTALGMVKLKQRKFAEARTLLEKAIAGDQANYIAYYRYAYLLSREGRDEFGYVRDFTKENAEKMRAALKKAISLSPGFTESYELLAYVNLVRNEDLDESIALLQKARAQQPGNQRYALRIGEIYSRQNKLDEAVVIAEKIAATADDPEIKSRAENLLQRVKQIREIEAMNAAEKKRFDEAVANASKNGQPVLVRRIDQREPPSEAELKRRQDEASLRTINQALRAVGENETRISGRIVKIDCKTRPIGFHVKTADKNVIVMSKDFDSVEMNAYEQTAKNISVGCETNISAINALVTYRKPSIPRPGLTGDLVAIEFIPDNFRILTPDELKAATLVIYEEPGEERVVVNTPPRVARDPEAEAAAMRARMMDDIRRRLKSAAADEKREIGFLDRIECGNKGTFFHLRTAGGKYRFNNVPEGSLRIGGYTPDLAGVQFGCDLKPVEFPVVFIYLAKPDAKAKTDGILRSLEFVPVGFTLEP